MIGKKLLQDKTKILNGLDDQIIESLDPTSTPEQYSAEIEEADTYNESVYNTLTSIDDYVSGGVHVESDKQVVVVQAAEAPQPNNNCTTKLPPISLTAF